MSYHCNNNALDAKLCDQFLWPDQSLSVSVREKGWVFQPDILRAEVSGRGDSSWIGGGGEWEVGKGKEEIVQGKTEEKKS